MKWFISKCVCIYEVNGPEVFGTIEWRKCGVSGKV